MPAPEVIGKGTASASTGTTVTPSYPAGLVADDIIILSAICHDYDAGGSASAPSINVPVGFTSIDETTRYTADRTHYQKNRTAWKRATGSESGTLSVTRDAGGNDVVLFANLYIIRGCPTSGNPYGSRTLGGGVVSTINFGALIGTIGPNASLMAICSQADAILTAGTPSGYSTLVVDTTLVGQGAQLGFFYKENVSVGTKVTASDGSANSWLTSHIEFNPAVITYNLKVQAHII